MNFQLSSFEFITHRGTTYLLLLFFTLSLFLEVSFIHYLILLLVLSHLYLGINVITADYMHDSYSSILFRFFIDAFFIFCIKSCTLIFIFF